VKKCIFIILIFVSCEETFSKDLQWKEGVVVLQGREVRTGKISVDLLHDVVLLKASDNIIVLPAFKIQSLSYYDVDKNMHHRFVSVQQRINSFTTYRLFEIVVSGEINVYRRLSGPFADRGDDRSGYHYFISLKNEQVSLSKFRSRVFPYIRKTRKDIAEYIKENHLSANNQAHAILIIDYFNKCNRTNELLAKH
jgi:hypothetical protein